MDKADINISTNSIVSIIIAIVIIGMVLIPIVNSLGDGNGSGGNEDSSEPQKTVINSWDESVGLTSTKYKSYDVYVHSETPTLPHKISYTLDDILDMAETFTPTGDVEDVDLSLIEAYNYEQSFGVYFEGSKLKFHTSTTTVEHNEVDSFTVNIATDYTVSYSLKTSNSDDVLTAQYTADIVSILSESEYGWEFLDSDEKVAVGSKVILDATIPPESESYTYKQIELTQDMFSDNQLQFTVDWGEGYHSDVIISITPDTIPGVSVVDFWDMNMVDGNGNPVDTEYGIDYLTTYGTPSSDNNTIINVGEHYYTPRENSRIDYLFRVVDDVCEIRSSPDLGSVEPVVVTHIPYVEGDETPYLCIAFGEGGSLWWSKGGYICMARSSEYGTTTIPSVSIDYASISTTGEYDSHTYGNMTGLDYYLAVDGTYVYSETNPKASLTDTIYISAPTLNANDRAVSVHSFGTPQNALDNIAGNYDTTVTNVDAHYTVGDYVSIDSVDVAYTIDDTPGEMTVKGFFVPKEFTYTPQSDDSGSGSGSNGMTSAIISLIPIFAVLGLLIFILNKLGIIDAITKSR